MVRERLNHGFSGALMLVLWWAILIGAPVISYLNWAPRRPPVEVLLALPLLAFLAKGFFIVAPNQAKVLQLFGSYVGTATNSVGFRYAGASTSQTGSYLRVSAPAYTGSSVLVSSTGYTDTLTVTVSAAP